MFTSTTHINIIRVKACSTLHALQEAAERSGGERDVQTYAALQARPACCLLLAQCSTRDAHVNIHFPFMV